MIPLVFYYFAQLTNWDMKKIFICWSPVSLSETELRCTGCNAVWGGFDAMDEVTNKEKNENSYEEKKVEIFQ